MNSEEKLEIMRVFALYDEDQNKTLDHDEFVESVQSMYSRTMAIEIFDIIDLNKSNGINPWEFLAFFQLAGDIADEDEYCMHVLGYLDHGNTDHLRLSTLLQEEDKVARRTD
jgi:hypothetical protein